MPKRILDTSQLKKRLHRLHNVSDKHRTVIKQAGDAQHAAKKAIFAIHRGDVAGATTLLTESKKSLLQLQKKYAQADLLSEGSFKAALEEYAEAVFLSQHIAGETIGTLKSITMPDDVYIAGLGDVPGELYRLAVRDATKGDEQAVYRHAEAAAEVVSVLVGLDLTKYLRTKTDQAKQALHKIEQVLYDLELRRQ